MEFMSMPFLVTSTTMPTVFNQKQVGSMPSIHRHPLKLHQNDVTAKLALMQFARKMEDEDACSVSKRNRSEFLSILNWIALCFVRETKGDVVATALSSDEASGITLYIALNRGKPTEEDLQNADAFKCSLQDALQVNNPVEAAKQNVATSAHKGIDAVEATNLIDTGLSTTANLATVATGSVFRNVTRTRAFEHALQGALQATNSVKATNGKATNRNGAADLIKAHSNEITKSSLTTDLAVASGLADSIIEAQALKFFKLATAISYRRIDHKINLLTASGNSNETVEERFRRIVDEWGGCASNPLNIEQNPRFLRDIRQLALEPLPGEPNGNDILKQVFCTFVANIRQQQDAVVARKKSTSTITHVLDPEDPEMDAHAQYFCQMARVLAYTDFLNQSDKSPSGSFAIRQAEDRAWINKLR